ncbi:hypothetical protein [Aeromicrobium sp. Leaf350]|uniref:hypothetical protein n=1 Tax=Aeromicrobium sp. Leaf350 TaxID=2876565 RepID=UPI001E631732|nr:hypothetical protein [Aeromicrobium sp. Leaf350]
MLRKTTILAAAAVGYVLGARAGRERYEQIVSAAGRVKSDPHVQKAANQAQDYAAQQAPVVKEKAQAAAGKAADKAAEAAATAKDKVQDLVSSDDVPTPDTSVKGAPSGKTPKAHGDPLPGTPENPVQADDA